MSLSINTNTSSMVALETLNATQSQLSATENAVSTGKKVANASDGPASFGIASQMNGNISGQSAVNDGLSYASSVVSSTNTASNQILSVLAEIQNAVTSIGNNSGSTTSLSQINDEINGYLGQIDTIANGATTNGVNLLAGKTDPSLAITASSLQYVTGLQGSLATVTNFSANASVTADASLSVMLGLAKTGAAGTNTVTGTITTAGTLTETQLQAAISTIQAAITTMTNFTSQLGNNTKQIANLTTFGQSVTDNLTTGVGALTDADMSAESAKLTSLQTKQSLAIKSLSIANGQSQNILSLFQ
ncbi:flagellin [Acetobacter syzygii]|uniref:flagellin n=1 Tax=Acetobacter syzygii TaxID=146476 RepID=UPI0015704F92|nr:flagellin C [Acetobacter syzygii]